MAYAEYTAQYPVALATTSNLLEPDNDGTTTTLLQNITGASPGEGAKLYLTSGTNFGAQGGVVNIVTTGERISYSATGTDGTGDFATVEYRALPGGAGASSATAGDSVRDVISAEHFKRIVRELIATEKYLGTNASQTAPVTNALLVGTSASASSWDISPTVDNGMIINEAGADSDTRIEGLGEANLFYVDAGNDRIGIGTATPTKLLELDTEVGGNATFNVANLTGIRLYASDSGGGYRNHGIAFETGAGEAAFIGAHRTGAAAHLLKFGTNDTVRMTIDTSGNVGIGTATPNDQLHLAGAAGASVRIERVDTGVTDDNLLGDLVFTGGESTPDVEAARIGAFSDGAWSASSQPSKLSFWTTPAASTTDTERMRIDSAGNVGINETSPNATLHVVGDVAVEGMLNLADSSGNPPELTISAGAVTATQSFHHIDTEADAASDDLDTINGHTTGDILILRAADNGRTVVVKDATGNIRLDSDTDFSLDSVQDLIGLFYTGGVWIEIFRSSAA